MSRLIVAITGGIASGKSTVCLRFAERGIEIADADVLARRLVAPGAPALEQIFARFGPAVGLPDGTLDRSALRAIVFSDAAARRDLEAILHPRIRAGLRAACEGAASPYAIAAIPLLAEGGGRAAYPWLERILVVDVAPEVQVRRLIARDGVTPELARRMLAAQASREARLAIADDVIDNGGDADGLASQVDALHRRYLEIAAARA